MRKLTITICAATLLFACKSSDKKTEEAKPEDTKVAAAATTEPSADIPDSVKQKNWQSYMTPGKEHQMLASWDGTWTGQVTSWMSPGTPPSMSTMTSVNKMIMGGRYQQSTNTGNFGGMPFEGISTIAFDNARKVFIMTWIDNMGTGIMKTEGTWDASTNSITFTGKMVDPYTYKEVDFREVMKVTDPDHQILEMYGPGPDGKEYKSMEIRLSRNK